MTIALRGSPAGPAYRRVRGTRSQAFTEGVVRQALRSASIHFPGSFRWWKQTRVVARSLRKASSRRPLGESQLGIGSSHGPLQQNQRQLPHRIGHLLHEGPPCVWPAGGSLNWVRAVGITSKQLSALTVLQRAVVLRSTCTYVFNWTCRLALVYE